VGAQTTLTAVPTVCEIAAETSLLTVRASLRTAASELGFGIVAQTKLITAASELARNILRYAGTGTMAIEQVQNGGRVGLRVRFDDQGSGIADLEMALRDGYSTSNSLGVGLSGARRLVDDFHIESQLGRGTTVQIVAWAR
jgi:serine/threonine-protein kinase RsbT